LRSDPTMRRDGQRQSPRNTGDQSRLELLSIVTRAAQTAGDCPHLQSRLKELAKILSRPNFFRAVSKDSENCRAGSTSAMNTGDHVDICPYSRGATRMNFMLLHESAHSTSYNLAIYRGADCDLVNSSTITRDNISTWDACPGEQDANALAFAALSRAGEGGHDFGKQNYQCNGPSH
jgi:hypothetical protein